MTFPFQCRKLLDQGERLQPEQIEQFWNQLSQLPTEFESEGPQLSEFQIEDAICGGIAVLTCLHSDWLDSHLERDEWCKEWLGRIISEPPSRGPIYSEVSLFDRYCDSFLANIAASEWAANPEDEYVRELVASIAMSLRYETVGILFRSAFRQRDKLAATTSSGCKHCSSSGPPYETFGTTAVASVPLGVASIYG